MCIGTIGCHLFADTAKAGDVLGTALGLPVPLAAALFVATVGGSCFLSSAQQMDKINSALVALVVIVFLVRRPLIYNDSSAIHMYPHTLY